MKNTQMLKGLLEGCILEIICKQETYAYEISQKLESYGFDSVSEGTIYPIILRMQKNDLIKATLKVSPSGPKRKYYHLTEAGKAELDEFKVSWEQLKTAITCLMEGETKEDVKE